PIADQSPVGEEQPQIGRLNEAVEDGRNLDLDGTVGADPFGAHVDVYLAAQVRNSTARGQLGRSDPLPEPVPGAGRGRDADRVLFADRASRQRNDDGSWYRGRRHGPSSPLIIPDPAGPLTG